VRPYATFVEDVEEVLGGKCKVRRQRTRRRETPRSGDEKIGGAELLGG
jgi:hypothetical protein